MGREFSFRFAIGIALLIHALLGIVLKFNPMVAASPVGAPQRAPMTVRFVEVPPDAKSVPETPRTNNVSDANRKAGPLKKAPESNSAVKSIPSATGSRTSRPAPANVKEEAVSKLPEIQPPDWRSSQQQPSSESQPEIALPGKTLAQSLRNLDQYIGPGGSGSGDDLSAGGEPGGDPGSGVFFDTRGFDLGPWGNRVVALVKSNWLVPVAAELGVKGVVAIAFQVDKNGTILNPQITSSSNVPSFDQAALNALKTSNPFPPLPADFPRKTLAAVFRFYYNLPVPN